jgi:carbon-monoxide dehydrogenase large subunit
MVMKTPTGPQEMAGHFATDGETITGKFTSDQGDQEFAGTLEGTRVKFDLAVEQPMKIILKYDLLFEGDSVSGKAKMGMFGSAKITGERV